METQAIELQTDVTFKWDNLRLMGAIEKEYENSFLVQVENPSKEIMEKYEFRRDLPSYLTKPVPGK